jgi:hypothetical protein
MMRMDDQPDARPVSSRRLGWALAVTTVALVVVVVFTLWGMMG